MRAIFIFLAVLCAIACGPEKEEYDLRGVLVEIKLSNDNFGETGESFDYYELEDRLIEVLGEDIVDGHGVGEGFFTIYTYDKNPEQLASKITEVLKNYALPKGSYLHVTLSPKGDQFIERKL